MNRRSPRSAPRRGTRSGWMAKLAIGVTLLNALMRLAAMFRGRGRRGGGPPAERPSAPRSQTSPVPRGRTSDGPAAWEDQPHRNRAGPVPQPAQQPPQPTGSDGGITDLFKRRQSDAVVQASGTVVKILPDETDTSDGSGMHQKFLVELLPVRGDSVTVKVCHNLKFGRVPLNEQDVVGFRGEYEWTENGGTVHWTHHDPAGRHPGGWIEHNGKRYE